MKKILLTCVMVGAICASSNAQFRMDKDYPTAGIKVVTDSVNGIRNVLVDFNTDKPLTLITDTKGQNAQTQKGVQVKVYNELGMEALYFAKCNNYGSNGNPFHVSDVNFVREFGIVDTIPVYDTKQHFWEAAACLFDVDGTDLTNQAFGVYPGIYKKVDYRFYFNFGGYIVNSDLEFDIMTFDAGNTGKTANYKLMVSFDSDKTSIKEDDGKTPDYTIVDFYTTGSGMQHVKLAETLGVDPSVFTNKKVYIALYTDGSGDAIQFGKYDPVITIDNFKVQYTMASWLNPAAGIAGVGKDNWSNIANPVKNISIDGNDMIFPVYLKAQGRSGEFTVVNDVAPDLHSTKDFSFLPTGGVKAKDASGNYTVDIAYTYAPDVEDVNGIWSKEKITIAAPASLGEVDDICVYVKYVKKESDTDGKIINDKLELSCGVRIWYTFYGQIDLSANSIEGETVSDSSMRAYSKSGKIYVENVDSEVSVYTVSGQLVKSVSVNDIEKGISVVSGVYLVSAKGQTTQKVMVN